MGEEKRIIVVDDDPGGLVTEEVVRYMGGYLTVYCNSAASALSIIQYEFVPDLVITDLQMPVMDGAELTRILKEKVPSLPIIILTGRPSLVPKDSPADMVIEKPCFADTKGFLKKIRSLMQ